MSNAIEIETSYGIENAFYDMFLDRRKIYTCGLFLDTDDLDQAQLNKLNYISDCAHLQPGMRVLDIGCGWGGNLSFMAHDRGAAQAVGITLSAQQFEEVRTHFDDKVTAELTDYRDYAPDGKFDAVTSIGMFEHVATPEEARSGRHIEIYRDYFRRAWEWTNPGAWFGLQTVTQLRIARDIKLLRAIGSVTYGIFPGAITPRLEAIMAAVNPYWEVVSLQMRREHYSRTCAAWRANLNRNREEIVLRWGEARFTEYDSYFKACIDSFDAGYTSLAQISLRRIDSAGGRR
jgi:cyclopropane-fatty-acyl-phospholipid synthase